MRQSRFLSLIKGEVSFITTFCHILNSNIKTLIKNDGIHLSEKYMSRMIEEITNNNKIIREKLQENDDLADKIKECLSDYQTYKHLKTFPRINTLGEKIRVLRAKKDLRK